ncbi:hypothetical protein BDZ91DRAFT_530278 [Kalaharituber pfeilii]|nr:hypothetical protein BDZ91DRAFT_530278 [Kalaharituber pfeilii]
MLQILVASCGRSPASHAFVPIKLCMATLLVVIGLLDGCWCLCQQKARYMNGMRKWVGFNSGDGGILTL